MEKGFFLSYNNIGDKKALITLGLNIFGFSCFEETKIQLKTPAQWAIV